MIDSDGKDLVETFADNVPKLIENDYYYDFDDHNVYPSLPRPLPCLDTNNLEEKYSELPLVSISKMEPHVMMLLVKPNKFVPNSEASFRYFISFLL